MRKIYLFLISIMLLIPTSCGSVKSTDLKNVSWDNIKLGANIKTLDLSKYEVKNEIDNDYNYEFKELQLKTKDNKVDKIHLYLQEDSLLSINEETNLKTINDVTKILGFNYKEYWFDKEQSLKTFEYNDTTSNIKINFVYNGLSDTKELVWAIFENL
ncbi:MAG: hypothetical protein ACRDCW_08560 [Sarcina sp.]